MNKDELIERLQEDKRLLQRENKEYREEILKLREELNGFRNTGLTPEEVSKIKEFADSQMKLNENIYKQLAEYRDAEEQGLLIKLPCKVGDTVYTVEPNWAPCHICEHGEENDCDVGKCLESHKDYKCPSVEYYIEEHICNGFEVTDKGIELVEEWGYDETHIFEPYYLTREAAEKALKGSVPK